MPQQIAATNERRVLLLMPGILAVVLYSIYVLSTNFSEPENFSVPFLLQSIFFFYMYLFVIQKVDGSLQNRLRQIGEGWRRVTGFLTALVISLLVSLVFYALMKQFYIFFLGQNDTITAYHLATRSLSTFVGFVLVYSIYISVRTLRELYLLKEESNIIVDETEETFTVTIPLLNWSVS